MSDGQSLVPDLLLNAAHNGNVIRRNVREHGHYLDTPCASLGMSVPDCVNAAGLSGRMGAVPWSSVQVGADVVHLTSQGHPLPYYFDPAISLHVMACLLLRTGAPSRTGVEWGSRRRPENFAGLPLRMGALHQGYLPWHLI